MYPDRPPPLAVVRDCKWVRQSKCSTGALAGISGVLIGFSSDQNCLIELDIVQRGVVLVIGSAAVTAKKTTPAGLGVCK